MFGGIKLDAKCMVMLVGNPEFSNKKCINACLGWVSYILTTVQSNLLKKRGFCLGHLPCGTKKTYPPPQRGETV